MSWTPWGCERFVNCGWSCPAATRWSAPGGRWPRLARRRGFVPLSTAVLGEETRRRWGVDPAMLWRLISCRHLLLLHQRRQDETPRASRQRLAGWLSRFSETVGRPRVVVVFSRLNVESLVSDPVTGTTSFASNRLAGQARVGRSRPCKRTSAECAE